MERQTFRASRIVNNLLEFSRDRPREARPVSLTFVIGECLDLLKERLRESSIEVEWQAPEDELTVLGHDGELLQVFTNLVVNASDAMKEGGHLRLRHELSEKWIQVSVEDEGPGIAPEHLDRVFQPFFSTKLQEGGTGLGLSISYNIVQRHGGRLRVSSAPGEGCTFFVELPRHRG
jgi:signal transduction histidine kinase